MSYTIYPDVLFVTNLVMDFLLLRLVKKLCRGKEQLKVRGDTFGCSNNKYKKRNSGVSVLSSYKAIIMYL